MLEFGRVGLGAIASALVALSPAPVRAQPSTSQSPPPLQATPQHDGQHDFDYLVGSWKIHLKRRLHPLTGSNEWVKFDGTGTCRKIFDGAQIEQGEWNGPSGRIVG